MAYAVGDLIRVSAIFMTNNVDTDPATVTLKHKDPGGTATTWVYLTDAQVVKDSTGNYHGDINVTTAGTWNFRWEGTGTIQGVGQSNFTVDATNI